MASRVFEDDDEGPGGLVFDMPSKPSTTLSAEQKKRNMVTNALFGNAAEEEGLFEEKEKDTPVSISSSSSSSSSSSASSSSASSMNGNASEKQVLDASASELLTARRRAQEELRKVEDELKQQQEKNKGLAFENEPLQKILVIGSTGRLGLEILRLLLKEQNTTGGREAARNTLIRAFVRDKSKAETLFEGCCSCSCSCCCCYSSSSSSFFPSCFLLLFFCFSNMLSLILRFDSRNGGDWQEEGNLKRMSRNCCW
jgi:hypothetical protein